MDALRLSDESFGSFGSIATPTLFSDNESRQEELVATMRDEDVVLDLSDDDPNADVIAAVHDNDIRFHVIEEASERGRELLIDNRGFTFCVKSRRGATTYWRCCVRNNHVTCPATIIQKADEYIEGAHDHVHEPRPGLGIVTKVRVDVKSEAARNIFEPAPNIVDRVITNADLSQPIPTMPNPINLARAANRFRRVNKPADPSDVNFVLDAEHIPADFLVDDIRVDNGGRHIIFATPTMLHLLAKAKHWFVDATFKVVKEPFYQLMTIHVFVKREGAIKQIPLVYVLMSARHKCDYKEVFNALKRRTGSFSVRCIVSDFESAIWRAVKAIFGDDIEHRGCTFHWSQAVWRQLQKQGLATAYMEHDSVHRYCRRIMSLPFLPAAAIVEAFDRIKIKATDPKLVALVDYVERTWITNSTWPPTVWSAYRRTIRTNNDCESWHARLNRRAVTAQLPFYKLITLLHRESAVVNVGLQLLSEEKLQRHPKRNSAPLQKRLNELWAEYDNKTRTADELLRACARIYSCNI